MLDDYLQMKLFPTSLLSGETLWSGEENPLEFEDGGQEEETS